MYKFLLLFSFLGLVACSPSDQNNKSSDQYLKSVSATGGEFGQLNQTDSAKIATVLVTNNGDEILAGPFVSSSVDFSIIYQNCSNLKVGKRCQIKVSFDPKNKNPQIYSADLVFDSVSIPVSAEVLAPAGSSSGGTSGGSGGSTGGSGNASVEFSSSSLVISSSLDYGTLTDKQSILKTIAVKNNGTSTINQEVTLSDNNFQIIFNACSNKNIAPGKICQLKVNLNGSGKSGAISSTLTYAGASIELVATVTSSVAGGTSGGTSGGSTSSSSPNVVFSEGTTQLVEPFSVNFGSLQDSQSKQVILYAKNTGTLASVATPAVLTGSDFSIIYNQCNNRSLAPNASCQIRLSFSAAGKSNGPYSSTLSFAEKTVTLSAEVSTVAVVVTYSPNYSEYSSCQVGGQEIQSCDGSGERVRSILSCQKLSDGQPDGIALPSFCNAYQNDSYLKAPCSSPAGNRILDIANGQRTVNCAFGSNVQNFVSISCSNESNAAGFHSEDNLTCVANTRTCNPLPQFATAGTQVYSGGSWGSCAVSGCEENYTASGSSCTPVVTADNRVVTIIKNQANGRLYMSGQEVCANQLTCDLVLSKNQTYSIDAYDTYPGSAAMFAAFDNCFDPNHIMGQTSCLLENTIHPTATVSARFTGVDTSSGDYASPYSRAFNILNSKFNNTETFLKLGESQSYLPTTVDNSSLNVYTLYSNVSLLPENLSTSDNSLQILPGVLSSNIVKVQGSQSGDFSLTAQKDSLSLDHNFKLFPNSDFGYGGVVDFRRMLKGADIFNTATAGMKLSISDDNNLMIRFRPSNSGAIVKLNSLGQKDNSFVGASSNNKWRREFTSSSVNGSFYPFVGGMSSHIYNEGNNTVVVSMFNHAGSAPLGYGSGRDIVIYKLNSAGQELVGPSLTTFSNGEIITRGVLSGVKDSGGEFFDVSSSRLGNSLYLLSPTRAYIHPNYVYSSKLFKFSMDTVVRDSSFVTNLPAVENLPNVQASNNADGTKYVCFKVNGSCDTTSSYARHLVGSHLSSSLYVLGFPRKTVTVGSSNYSYDSLSIMKLEADGSFDSNYSDAFFESNNYVNYAYYLSPGYYLPVDEDLFLVRNYAPIPTENQGGGVVITPGVLGLIKINSLGQKDSSFNASLQDLTNSIYPIGIHMFHADANYVYYGYKEGDYSQLFKIGRFSRVTGAKDPSYGNNFVVYLSTTNLQTSNPNSPVGSYFELSDVKVKNGKAFIVFEHMMVKVDIASGQIDTSTSQTAHISCSGEELGSWDNNLQACVCNDPVNAEVVNGVCELKAKNYCESYSYGINNQYGSWDSYERTCNCPDNNMQGYDDSYFNYATNTCESVEVDCGAGYWSGDRCECPDGYFDSYDTNDNSGGMWDGNSLACRPKDSYINCQLSGGSYSYNSCSCPGPDYELDYSGSCVYNPQISQCNNGGGYWQSYGGGSGYCYCYNNGNFEYDSFIDAYRCIDPNEVACTGNGGTWESVNNYCNYNCGTYTDSGSCSSTVSGQCYWSPNFSSGDCSSLDESACYFNSGTGCYWDSEMFSCFGSYQYEDGGFCFQQ